MQTFLFFIQQSVTIYEGVLKSSWLRQDALQEKKKNDIWSFAQILGSRLSKEHLLWVVYEAV